MGCEMTDLYAAQSWKPRSWGRKVLILVLLVATFGVLQGCAGGASPQSSSNDLVTDSDESPARKRAKIRLELAAGYYNNGQTTVALDELKQVVRAFSPKETHADPKSNFDPLDGFNDEIFNRKHNVVDAKRRSPLRIPRKGVGVPL